jgi:hypothetical protein
MLYDNSGVVTGPNHMLRVDMYEVICHINMLASHIDGDGGHIVVLESNMDRVEGHSDVVGYHDHMLEGHIGGLDIIVTWWDALVSITY